jgi:prolyl-tRNA editing enzyme YbaK/EbsC (Cys-tRNA(Pro) deacylase)
MLKAAAQRARELLRRLTNSDIAKARDHDKSIQAITEGSRRAWLEKSTRVMSESERHRPSSNSAEQLRARIPPLVWAKLGKSIEDGQAWVMDMTNEEKHPPVKAIVMEVNGRPSVSIVAKEHFINPEKLARAVGVSTKSKYGHRSDANLNHFRVWRAADVLQRAATCCSVVRMVKISRVHDLCGFPVGRVPAVGHAQPLDVYIDDHVMKRSMASRLRCAHGMRVAICVFTLTSLPAMAAETVAAGIGVEGMHVVIAPKLLADLAGAKVAKFAQAMAPVKLEELPVCVNGRLTGRQGMRLGTFIMVVSILSSGSESERGRNPCHLHKRRMGRLL